MTAHRTRQSAKDMQAILSSSPHSDIISLDDVLDIIKMKEKEKILSQHIYDIWQATDGRWKTYLPDESKKNNRRLVAKSNLENLHQLIVDDYKQRNKKPEEKMTLRKLYPEWFAYKELHTNSTTYMHVIDNAWNRFYLNDTIIDRPLESLDKITLETWALQKIKELNLTKKQYYNNTVIIRQSLAYALEKTYIQGNSFEDVKINAKLFRKVPKKEDSTQVYLLDEQKQIIHEALKDFGERGHSASLAVALYFQLGLRVGELVALKKSDINGNYLKIERMEVRQEEKLPNGKWKRTGYLVVNHTKTEAGRRSVYLTKEARKYLQMILDHNKINGYADGDYLLLDDQGRIHELTINSHIRRYCNLLGMPIKSSHKIRKTYISNLIDSGLNINKVRSFAGHESELTTYNSYCYSRLSDKQTEELLEKALCN